MEPKTDLIRFECDGVEYAMTKGEIEAAYRYRRHQHRLGDAKRQLNTLIFGCDDGSGFDDPEGKKIKEDFQQDYGISYDVAISLPMLEEYLRRFEGRFNCDYDENSQWEAAIRAALADGRCA